MAKQRPLKKGSKFAFSETYELTAEQASLGRAALKMYLTQACDDELKRLQEEVERKAKTDNLNGLLSRRDALLNESECLAARAEELARELGESLGDVAPTEDPRRQGDARNKKEFVDGDGDRMGKTERPLSPR